MTTWLGKAWLIAKPNVTCKETVITLPNQGGVNYYLVFIGLGKAQNNYTENQWLITPYHIREVTIWF